MYLTTTIISISDFGNLCCLWPPIAHIFSIIFQKLCSWAEQNNVLINPQMNLKQFFLSSSRTYLSATYGNDKLASNVIFSNTRSPVYKEQWKKFDKYIFRKQIQKIRHRKKLRTKDFLFLILLCKKMYTKCVNGNPSKNLYRPK